MNSNCSQGRFIAIAVAWLCVIGSVGAFLTAWDIAVFLYELEVTRLANSVGDVKLGFLAILLGVLAILLGITAWMSSPGRSVHRHILASWSPAFVFLWATLLGFLLLAYYPLPPENAHVDKLLPLSVLLLVWSVSFVASPLRLDAFLKGGLYQWLRVVIVNLVIFVVIAEIGLRLADPLLARHGIFGDKQTPAYLKPHHPVRGSIGITNSQGFRDLERSIERRNTAPRIIALGDSFTWGAWVSYDETFVTLLERAAQISFPGIEIINMGVSGWDPPEEFHLLKIYGIRFNPDLVLLNFFVGNDIMRKRGYVMEQAVVVAGQSFYVHSNGRWFHDTLGFDRWYLYHDMNYLLHVGAAKIRAAWEQLDHDHEAVESPRSLFVSRAQHLRYIDERSEIYRRENTPLLDFHWDRTRSVLQEMRDFLQARGIPLFVVMIPTYEQVDHELQQQVLEFLNQPAERYDFEKPQRLLRNWCVENEVQFVDLLPLFKAQSHLGSLYVPNDIHWNRAGHEFGAATIQPVLEGQISSITRVQSVGKRRRIVSEAVGSTRR